MVKDFVDKNQVVLALMTLEAVQWSRYEYFILSFPTCFDRYISLINFNIDWCYSLLVKIRIVLQFQFTALFHSITCIH